MAKKKTTTTEPSAGTSKISPFKDHSEFEKEIRDFANKYKTTVVNHAKRTSDYFEMSCFNYVVRYYEHNGYAVDVKNLQSGKYRYKCSPAGIQSNFSHFLVMKEENGRMHEFEIHHNLAAQSSQDQSIFTSPDISIVDANSVRETTEYYDSKTRFSYIENHHLKSFCEVKQFNPFPELLFNFMGVVNELKKEYMIGDGAELQPIHLAPTLMISGKPNKQTERIKKSLESRYWINVIYDLFYTGGFTFSKGNVSDLRKAGKSPVLNSVNIVNAVSLVA